MQNKKYGCEIVLGNAPTNISPLCIDDEQIDISLETNMLPNFLVRFILSVIEKFRRFDPRNGKQ